MKQYINISRLKNQLCVREIVDNVEYRRKVKFKPYLFQRSSKSTEYKDFYDTGYVKKVTFENPYEMREFIELYKDIPNELWGNKDIISQFMYDEKYDCFDFSNIVVSYLDIEVCIRSQNENGDWIDGGFPEASEARFPINAICDYRSNTKKYYAFTTAQGWTKDSSQLKYADEVEYIYCKNEQDLIKKWLTFWVKNTPHIITGWNCKLFDIPYIVNRIKILFGNDIACRLSPFNTIESKEVASGFGNKLSTYEILGVSIIDYLDLYKKYRNVPREKYTLDFISRAENPEEHKLEFKGTHGSLYYDNPRFFVDYNIQDVRCVVCFENKLQLLQLATNLSYFSNINFEDNFSPIKIWETVISKTCLDNNIVIPMRFKTPEKKPYEGAYVHEPVTGLKGCVASFDYTSLYPKIMELFYIGADVHCRNEEKTKLYEGLLKTLENDTSSEAKEMLSEIKMTGIFNEFYMKNDMPKSVTKFLQNNEVSLTTNCEFYKVSRKSIFVSLITKLFNERKSDKKTSFMYKHKAQDIKEELKRREEHLEEIDSEYKNYSYEELIKLYEESSRLAQTYHISQLVKKVLLNSLYGALGNNHFLLYTHEMARGITLMGRCLIRKAAFAKNKYISNILNEKEVKDRLIYGDTDSCVGTTNIVVNDTLMTMEDFYNQSVGIEVKNINDKFVKQLSSENNYTTLSLDNHDVVTTNINYVMKHKVKKHLWKINVDGKEVIVTDNHSIMFIRDNNLMKGSVDELRSDDIIVTINKK